MEHGNPLIIVLIARIQSASELVPIMHVMLTQRNGATTAHGLLWNIAVNAEIETLHALQLARKMFAIQRPIKDALTANGYY